MKISITGVDGTGKTSIIRAIRRDAREGRLGGVRAFRAPQYHEDPDAPHGALSARIEELSQHADLVRDPALKTCALFLSMTLYGDVEAHYARAYAPERLFSERQALADSLAYSRFYKGLLKGRLGAAPIPGEEALAPWLETVRARLPEGSPLAALEPGLRPLPLWIRALFDLPVPELVAHLRALYRCEWPDQVILLKVSPPRLAERLQLKARDGQAPELHEKQAVLQALQEGLEQSCRALQQLHPALRVSVLDTSELGLDASVQGCLGATVV